MELARTSTDAKEKVDAVSKAGEAASDADTAAIRDAVLEVGLGEEAAYVPDSVAMIAACEDVGFDISHDPGDAE